MSMSPLSMQKMMLPLIAVIILCISSISAAVNANNARHYQLRQPNKGADKHTSSSTIPRSLQLLNLNKNNNKNKTPRPDKTKRPTEPKQPAPTSSPSIDSLSPSIDSLDELTLDGDTNSTTEEEIFAASSVDEETHDPNDTIIDDGESLTDVYVVQDSTLEEDFIHRPLSGGNDKPIISSSDDMSKDTVEDVNIPSISENTKVINVGPFDMTFTMYNKDVAQPNKKKLLRLLQSSKKDEDTLEQIAGDLYSIAARDHLAAIYEATFSDIPSFDLKFIEDQDITSVSQGTSYNSKFDVDFYYDESNENDDIPSEDELKQMILLAFKEETNKEQFYQIFHDLYANNSNVQQIESVGEIGGTGAGALLQKLYNVDVQEVGLVAQEEANTASATSSEATTPSSSISSDSGISTGLLIALTVLSCAIIIVAIVGFTVYWKKYHRSSNDNRSGADEPKYWKPLNDNAEVADDLALVESDDLEQQQQYDMNIMLQMQVEGTPDRGGSEYGEASRTTQEVSPPFYPSSNQEHSQNQQQEQHGSKQYMYSDLPEGGSIVSGWSMSEVADHDDTTNVDEYTDDDGISLSNTSLVGAGELFRSVMRYDTDDDEGHKVVPDMGTDKLNTTTETEIVEDYDEDFLGYVVDNDDDDSESRGAFIKEILSRSDEEEDGGEENDFL